MDLYCTHEGDLELTAGADLARVSGRDAVLERIARCLKTPPSTWPDQAYFGLDLTPLIGLPLNVEALRSGEARIQEALSILATGTISFAVRGVPITETLAVFLITASPIRGDEAQFTIPFDMTFGVVEPRTATTAGTASKRQ